jgi:CorA-like Mg2+ transporter protein
VSNSFPGVVLVDPPLGNFSIGFSDFNAVTPSQTFDVVPYQGGYLDFIEVRKPLNRTQHDFRDCRHRAQSPNTFDDLVRHWQIQARDGLFKTDTPHLATFMRPAFQIAASECGNFFAYLQSTLESQNSVNLMSHDQFRIRRNLDRCIFIDTLLSRYKPILSRIKDYVHANADLKEDFRQLLLDLHHYRAECDSQIQHTTSVLQSHESTSMQNLSREAMRRADYLRYLTIIALIYAPFAIACAVFSMPHQFAPAAHYLYGFLPVTAVVTVLFLLLVLPESRDPLPSVKAALCGKLTRQKLLGKHRPESRDTNTTSSKRFGWDDV